MTPSKLAKELEIWAKKLRVWLKKEYARPQLQLGSRRIITPEMMNNAKHHQGFKLDH